MRSFTGCKISTLEWLNLEMQNCHCNGYAGYEGGSAGTHRETNSWEREWWPSPFPARQDGWLREEPMVICQRTRWRTSNRWELSTVKLILQTQNTRGWRNVLKSTCTRTCLCVAVSCLNKKFVIWFLPGAFQFSVVLSASATSFSHTGIYSMLGFCWYWFLIIEWPFFHNVLRLIQHRKLDSED